MNALLHRVRLSVLLGITPVVAHGDVTSENNWAQWRGPKASGVAPQGNPPTTWSETNHVKWKAKIPGRGFSTPIIWNDQLFVQTAIPTGRKIEAAPAAGSQESPPTSTSAPTPAPSPSSPAPDGSGRRRGGGGGMRADKPTEVQQFALVCLDRRSGKIRWQRTAREELPHEGHHRDHTFASHSPITDGRHIYAFFGSRGLYCYDLEGTLKWSTDFGDQRTRAGFGEGSSPALHGNTLVVNWDHEGEDFIVALDKTSGKELWRQPRNEITTWTTPLVIEHGARPQVVVSATKSIRSYDLASGKELWSASGMTENVIPTPVTGFDMVYCISGFRGASLMAIRLGKDGDLTETDAIAWRHSKSTPYVPSPLLYGEIIYFFSGNNGMLSAFDAKSGKALFEAERIDGLSGVYASPAGAAGRVYLVGRNGAVTVIKHSNQLEVLAKNQLDEKFDASPAIVGRDLYLRGHESLYCISEN